jgi:hypothetical protein
MKKIVLFSVLLVLSFAMNGCKKDSEKDYNTLKITSGEFSGFTHDYTPNSGFWSPATQTIRLVHLVLGGTENIVTDYLNKMSILFYYSGQQSIDFPSTDGQWVTFGLDINGIVYYFQAQDAVLNIDRLDDQLFEGSLSGDFVDESNGSRIINFNMDIRLDLQQI